ncbi:MAG: chromosome segregation protein SMC [Pirellulaceae bacterium]|nr:chromosome segregation protein SMC [Pirellulaceae bacterium]
MLTALELHGFKSFADKTRFEFPAGITVVVGPNGSGKSNIVDGIKWVLGEQSAKSLRGKDMADVIFKGAGNRKPMNTAEATIILDNSDRRLPIDAPEVHVTRRVFRSGEGEYLINRQPARLKDIKDLFRGTGVGGDAYSLIEQGKVDKLLNASAKDRRAMFEEAAGISRFKAKKIEAQRRLERVEQNLLRLSDIVEEVESRLKTVRAQAGKARRYREYSDRLQQLRTQIGLVDWRRLSEQLAGLESDLAALADQMAAGDAESQRLEASQLELEAARATIGEELCNCEQQLGFGRQQWSQHSATMTHERTRAAELDEEARLHGRNLLAMSDRAGDVRSRLKATQAEVVAAQTSHQAAADEASRREALLADLARQYEQARRQSESRRKEYLAQLQSAAALASQVETGQSQLAAVQQTVLHSRQQLADLAEAETELSHERAAAGQRHQAAESQLAAHHEQLEAAERELTENRNLHASRADDLAQLHSRRQGVAERAEVLAEFERTLEGIGAGVRQVLARAGVKSQEPGIKGQEPAAGESRPSDKRASAIRPWSLVRGVVADFVQVKVEHSAAIDAALGEAAQAVVVEGTHEQARELIDAAADVAGRVVVLPLDATSDAARETADAAFSLIATDVRGWIGTAASLVECPASMRPLVQRVLGSTWVVRTLADALRLAAELPPGFRCVTLDGELIEATGAITFGPRQSATSLISRRSQLRAARLDLAVLDQQIADAQRETLHLKREIDRCEQVVRGLSDAGKALEQQLAHERAALQSLAQQLARSAHQRSAAEAALAAADERRLAIEANLKQATQQLAEAQAAADRFQASLASGEQALAELEARRQQAAGELTAAKIELARCEQRVESLRLRLMQFEDDQRERERAIAQVRQQLRQARERQVAAELAMLAAGAQIALLAWRQEGLDRRVRDCAQRRDLAQTERNAVAEQLATLRKRLQKARDQQHQLQLAAEQVRHDRRTLADRLREDYGIELAEASEQPSPEEAQERVAVEAEIESLRRKINQIGAVNLDALDELDELEARFATLAGQHKDLTDARAALERIIHKINADSRRLFLETLEAIRVNFQALYRKAFGGGKADIVLEEGVDVLECGVDIIATPPGKPSFNNSLLSGGEKALTAVALLLAIFQFRPSPFCVLDEVDAPFDEANIGRFVDVLKDFLSWTRFVIVTHSKKTMTAATTLYGVTMQESGVSKRVSVRFDDVTDDGQIRTAALAPPTPADEEQRGVA